MEEQKEDLINRPNHYCKFNVELESLDMVDLFCFNLGSCIKYALRYRDKGNPVMDLQKALFYAKRLENCEYKKIPACQQIRSFEMLLKIFCFKSKDDITKQTIDVLIGCGYHFSFKNMIELLEERLKDVEFADAARTA